MAAGLGVLLAASWWLGRRFSRAVQRVRRVTCRAQTAWRGGAPGSAAVVPGHAAITMAFLRRVGMALVCLVARRGSIWHWRRTWQLRRRRRPVQPAQNTAARRWRQGLPRVRGSVVWHGGNSRPSHAPLLQRCRRPAEPVLHPQGRHRPRDRTCAACSGWSISTTARTATTTPAFATRSRAARKLPSGVRTCRWRGPGHRRRDSALRGPMIAAILAMCTTGTTALSR